MTSNVLPLHFAPSQACSRKNSNVALTASNWIVAIPLCLGQNPYVMKNIFLHILLPSQNIQTLRSAPSIVKCKTFMKNFDFSQKDQKLYKILKIMHIIHEDISALSSNRLLYNHTTEKRQMS